MIFAAGFNSLRRLAIIAVVIATLFPVYVAESETVNRDQVLVFGRVSADPKNAVPKIEGLASYLASRLDEFGIRRGEALVAIDNAQMIRYLREGRVDLASESALSAVQFESEAGAELLLREWKKGVPEYHTVFFTLNDSPIRSLADLAGRKIAFEDAGSTSSFLMPMAVLRRAGLEALELSGPAAQVPDGKVGYAFARTEINIPMWVVRGIADAGAFNNLDWIDLDRNPNVAWEQLRVFHTTKPIIRSAMLARAGLPKKLKAKITEMLLRMHETPEGREVLKSYYKVEQFDRIEGEVAKSLDRTRADYSFVHQLVE